MKPKLRTIDVRLFNEKMKELYGKGRSANDYERHYRRAISEARAVFLECIAAQAEKEAEDARNALT